MRHCRQFNKYLIRRPARLLHTHKRFNQQRDHNDDNDDDDVAAAATGIKMSTRVIITSTRTKLRRQRCRNLQNAQSLPINQDVRGSSRARERERGERVKPVVQLYSDQMEQLVIFHLA